MKLGMWMTLCLEVLGRDSWVFWKKKQLVEIWDWTKRVRIRIWARPVQLFAAGCARVCWVSELRADAERTVSIVKIVSLSLLESLKVKKVIKVSYLNQESRQCFGIPMHGNVFTYPYISRIRIMAPLHKLLWDFEIRSILILSFHTQLYNFKKIFLSSKNNYLFAVMWFPVFLSNRICTDLFDLQQVMLICFWTDWKLWP